MQAQELRRRQMAIPGHQETDVHTTIRPEARDLDLGQRPTLHHGFDARRGVTLLAQGRPRIPLGERRPHLEITAIHPGYQCQPKIRFLG
jgi:hypothetical protein